MKIKKYFYILLSLLYLEFIFNLFTYDSYLRSSLVNIVLFTLINSFLIFTFTNMWNYKVNKIVTYVIYSILPIWYGLYYVFYNLLLTPFSVALFRQTDQAMAFPENVIMAILENSYVLLLLFVPLILFILFREKLFDNDRLSLKNGFVTLGLFLLSIGIYVSNIYIQDRSTGSIYNLYFETNNISLNIERLGVMAATMMDIQRCIFGFEEEIRMV